MKGGNPKPQNTTSMMDRIAKADVRRSFQRCTLSPGFLDDFYDAFTHSSDEVTDRLQHTDRVRLKQKLKAGLSFLVTFTGPSPRVRLDYTRTEDGQKGSGQHKPFWMYDNWKISLLNTIKRHDRKITWQLLEEWEDVLQSGIEKLTKKSRHNRVVDRNDEYAMMA